MTAEHSKQLTAIFDAMQRHPRVAYQQLAASDDQLENLRASIPLLAPFEKSEYCGFLPILDWDHKLPSRVAILRVYAFYSDLTLRSARAEHEARAQQIAEQDEYPEFDVPDFAGISADEAYEGEVETSGRVTQLRLVSGWRRDIAHGDAKQAVQIARRSDEFKQVVSKARRRPDYLGDLEAVSWTPPCETAYATWTIDVWYLLDLDAAMGKGRSFLVDLNRKQVVGVREFVVRSG